MDLKEIPYMLTAREIKFGEFDTRKVYIALCLVNHLIIGVADNKKDALAIMLEDFNDMIDEAQKKGDIEDHLDGIDFDN